MTIELLVEQIEKCKKIDTVFNGTNDGDNKLVIVREQSAKESEETKETIDEILGFGDEKEEELQQEIEELHGQNTFLKKQIEFKEQEAEERKEDLMQRIFRIQAAMNNKSNEVRTMSSEVETIQDKVSCCKHENDLLKGKLHNKNEELARKKRNIK